MDQIIRRNRYHLEMIVMLAIFIVFFGIGMFLLTQKGFGNASNSRAETESNNENKQMMNDDKNMMNESDTWFKLETLNNASSYKVGDTVDVIIRGDSNGKDISGFDTLLAFDPSVFEVVQVKPLMKEFQVFTFKNPGYVSMTATKLLTVQAPTTFANSELIDVTLRAKSAGKAHLELKQSEGKEKTKMVDNQASIIIPGVGSMDLVIN